MNFGQALEHLKAGRRVAREGWSGKGMWLWLIQPERPNCRPYIEMRDAQGFFVPWVTSQTDVLAEDWGVL